jgi:ATP-dependent protease Clp ATPase subunit
MENEKPQGTVKTCSFCEREAKDTAFMCSGKRDSLFICNFCVGACLKAIADDLVSKSRTHQQSSQSEKS